MMIFLWAAIIGVAYLVVRAIAGQKTQSTGRESAIEILSKRYASGDISREEFKSKESDLIAQSERSKKP